MARTANDKEAARVAALEALVPEAKRLERLLADANAESLETLEDFASHTDFQRLAELLEDSNAQAADFNPFEELGLWWQEDVHSRVLSWLLGPHNSHRLGDYFLKSFLLSSGLVTVADMHLEWSLTTSQREWNFVVDGESGRVDILLVNERAAFVCAIENKIYAPEGGRQLTRYRKALEAEYDTYARYYVFLSPDGRESRWKEEQNLWNPMRYSTVLRIVEQIVDDKADRLYTDIHVFLRQYSAMLRRRIVPEANEIAKQARRIYLENRAIIELIYRHKPDYRAEMNEILRDAVRRQPNWLLDDTNSKYVRFCPASWEKFKCFRSGTGWDSKALILFEFHCTQRNTHFRLVLAPSKEPIRSVLFDRIKAHSGVFNYVRAGSPKEGYQHVHRKNDILSDSDLSDWYDTNSLGPSKLRQCVADFAENEFSARYYRHDRKRPVAVFLKANGHMA